MTSLFVRRVLLEGSVKRKKQCHFLCTSVYAEVQHPYIRKEKCMFCRYAEILQENRGFTPEEEELFDRGANQAYQEFRNKAAESRGMSPEQMEEFAQVRLMSS